MVLLSPCLRALSWKHFINFLYLIFFLSAALLVTVALKTFSFRDKCSCATTVQVQPLNHSVSQQNHTTPFFKNDSIFEEDSESVFQENHTLPNISSEANFTNKIVNPFNFKYVLLERENCSTDGNQSFFVLIVVHSHPKSYKNRMVIRQTWGSSRHYFPPTARFEVMFMMGSVPRNPVQMAAVRAESERYRDIVQADFEDTYKNLTYKAIMWMKWATLYCPEAHFLLKVDEDMFVNTFSMMSHLMALMSRGVVSKMTILCLVWDGMPVIREVNTKWYVSPEDYPNDYYSTYCSGSAYMFTNDLIPLLYEKALQTKFFWVDDFYATGLVPKAVGNVTYYDLGSLYTLKQDEAFPRLVHQSMIFAHLPNALSLRYKLWNEVLKWRNLNSSDAVLNETMVVK